MKMPSGCDSRIASAGAVPGMTVTLQPISTRCRRMFHFIPKSSATTCGRSASGGRQREASRMPCDRIDRSRANKCGRDRSPTMYDSRRHDFARQVAADQARAGLGLGHQAGIVEVDRREDSLHRPAFSRMCLTSSRVSIPEIPMMPCCSR